MLVGPRRARHLLTAQKVMFDAGEHAAPVTAVDGLVDHSFDFHVHAIAAEDAVVDAPEQIEQAALIPRRRIGGSRIALKPP